MVLNFNPLVCINCNIGNVLKEINNPIIHEQNLNSCLSGNASIFTTVPASRGVYVWGFKKEIDGKTYFCPWYVGLANKTTLQRRLMDHYLTTNFGKRELFNVFASAADFYQCIQAYNLARLNDSNKRKIVGDLCTFFCSNPTIVADNLIYFSNINFWPRKYGYSGFAGDPVQTVVIGSSMSLPDRQLIMQNRNYLAENFCFTYAEIPDGYIGNCIDLEKATKCFLEKCFGIYTSSKANGLCSRNIDVNLSEVNKGACRIELWRSEELPAVFTSSHYLQSS